MQKRNDLTSNHTFAVCAYKDSPHLTELLDSLFAQTEKSRIVIGTSTPTDLLQEKAKKYGIEVFINERREGIAADWNFAYSLADTNYVTLAHQDDVYEPEFTRKTLKAIDKCKDPIIVYTDYFEIRSTGRVYKNKLLKIKRLMNGPIGTFPCSRFIRKRVLSMGCPILCPSVTYNKRRFPEGTFDKAFTTNPDWKRWSGLLNEKGEFCYIKETLAGHRVYEQSTTSDSIANGVRYEEDLRMFREYWPAPIARFIMKFYAKAMESNDESKPE